MERLTENKRNSDGTGVSKQSLIDRPGKGYPSNYARSIVTRLAELEDLEEQGRLLRLPCNEVWFICDKGTKYATVMSKSINDLTVYEIRKIDKDGRYWSSKKKAEAKMAEMEGAE